MWGRACASTKPKWSGPQQISHPIWQKPWRNPHPPARRPPARAGRLNFNDAQAWVSFTAPRREGMDLDMAAIGRALAALMPPQRAGNGKRMAGAWLAGRTGRGSLGRVSIETPSRGVSCRVRDNPAAGDVARRWRGVEDLCASDRPGKAGLQNGRTLACASHDSQAARFGCGASQSCRALLRSRRRGVWQVRRLQVLT